VRSDTVVPDPVDAAAALAALPKEDAA